MTKKELLAAIEVEQAIHDELLDEIHTGDGQVPGTHESYMVTSSRLLALRRLEGKMIGTDAWFVE